MILNFSVGNYKVFKDRTELFMEATFDRSHPGNLLGIDEKQRVLNTALIYGANASGKTSFLEALRLMRDLVIGGGDLHETSPFIFDGISEKEPTSFEIDFIRESRRYVYGFSYDGRRIIEEHLFQIPGGKRRTIFKRNGSVYNTDSNRRIQKVVGENDLFVTVGAQLGHPLFIDVVSWFRDELYVITGTSAVKSVERIIGIIKNKEIRLLMEKALSIADFGISAIDVKKDNTAVGGMVKAWAEHKVGESTFEVPILSESSGTLRFLGIIGQMIDSLKNGRTIVIDDLDMNIHTEICSWMIGLFADSEENKGGGQIIVSLHDVGLLDQNMFRRDQIWFVSKDYETNKSSLVRLSDYKGVRKDLDIRKAYLNGSFGSRPFIAPERLME